MNRKSASNHKKIIRAIALLIIILALMGVALFWLETTNTTSFFGDHTVNNRPAATTSDVPSAQSDFNGGSAAEENKDPGNTTNENQGNAVISDTDGAASTNTSNPRTSQTGEITVYLPLDNTLIKNGQEVSGTSRLETVQYRLIDSVSGMIATGSLKVVNGRFSGAINFSTSASEGRLDIFATKADASEYSSVEIPVRFN